MNIHDYDNQMDNTRFLSKVDNIFILLMSGVMFDELENVKHKVNSYVYDRFSTICLKTFAFVVHFNWQYYYQIEKEC